MTDLENSIAIVGLSLRFPKANTQDEFWRNLVEGRDCGKTLDREFLEKLGVTKDKLDSGEYVYRSYELDDMTLFDAKFFGLSPREARMADPQLRIMLEAAHECIEDSGHILNGTNTGIYLGVAENKYWMYYNLFQSALEEQNEVAKRIVAVKDFFATQLSHKLGLNGPSISLSSACSTGLLATHEACNHLLMYDCDFAIAGGCEILMNVGYQYLEGGLSARDGYVRAFDKDASGTIFGSGAGMVMLRRLSDAVRDGDKIYAVIRSTAVNNDGNQKIGYMAPGVKGQMGVIHEAISRAGVSARDISYVEAHGTGTNVGDPIEIESISKVYRKYTEENQYCAIGSVKTNVGHLSIAAGTAGLIKTALMLHYKKVPPILHFKEANPAINFEESPFYVNRELRDWQPYNGKRIAGISAFGVGGTNVHAIVEEAPQIQRKVEPKPYQKVFVLTARSKEALSDYKGRLAGYLRDHPEVQTCDVAFTLNAGRQKFEHRLCIFADDRDKLIEACDGASPATQYVPTGATRQTVFMFPGQGSQYVDMGYQLYLQEPLFRSQVDECCREAKQSLGLDLLPILFSAHASEAGAQARINETEYTQICLFIISYSLARLWMQWGVKPNAMIGHSIGEYAAACLAGVFSVNDALKLVANRGRLMQSMPRGNMLSIPLAKEEVVGFLDDSVSIAGENSPASCVVSGTAEAIDKLAARLLQSNIKSNVLHTSHAFHSHMMDPILGAYEEIVRGIELRQPEIPFISNVTGEWITPEQATDPLYWVSQLREAVLFSKGAQTIATQDSVFLEIGPGATLCSLLGQNNFDCECLAVGTLPRAKDNTGAADFLASALGKACCYGVPVDWDAVFGETGGNRVSLPTYAFERKSYWLDEEVLKKAKASAYDNVRLEHPLLGRRVVSSSKAVVYENVIDKDTPKFIADHRLIETVIFPGAGYTQMALEVGKYFIKNKKIRIDEIRFAQVMMLHEGGKKVVQVIATANGDGCNFEILSRNLDDSEASDRGAWVLHAKGKVAPHSVIPEPYALPSLINAEGSELLPLSRYYDALKFITFGPSFRAIKRLWIGENRHGQLESVGLVELPQHLYPEVDQYSFHPVLLDAAFQVIDGPKISQSGTLPVGLRNFTVYDQVPNAFYVHAIRYERADEEYSIGEITVFSEKGSVIARIEHYLQKEIADSVVENDQLANVLFDIGWDEVGQEFAKQATAGNTWVLIGGENVLADRLRAALRQQNKSVINLVHGLIDDGNKASAHGAGKFYADVAAYQKEIELSKQTVDLIKNSQIDTVVFVKGFGVQSQADEDALDLSLNMLGLVQIVSKCDPDSPPRIVIATSGAQLVDEEVRVDEFNAHQAALWGIGNTVTIEHPEYRCLRADVDQTGASLDAFVSDLVGGDTLENQIAYRDGRRFTPRLRKFGGNEGVNSKIRLPSGPFEIRLSRFGTFDNFSAREFIPDLLADNEVMVEMQSVALNFKETLWVLGYLNPNKRHAVDFDFGMEGAGRIKRVGRGVTHLKKGDDVIVWHNGCMSSDFVVSTERVIRKPASLSYAAAACIPTVFMTAYYALHHLAKIKSGDRVLIHAAAGGVGQVAIQIAKSVGAEIYATASQGKWEHLRRQGVEHIFDSRTLEFSSQILEATGGEGVDIVFNSLAGEFIGKSFDVLGKNGRFVEIGKKDIWTNERASAYRPDVDYRFFEVGEDQVSGGIGGTSVIHDLMVKILDDFENGTLHELPMKEFSVRDAQQAYRYLSAGKNIGKVVVNFDRDDRNASRAPFVFPDKTYLVTGGLGGLGFLCAKWLIGHGAKNIALIGRSEPAGEVAREILDFNKVGINVHAIRGDIGVSDDVARIVQQIESSGASLGGVLHCAGVLEDALIEQQTVEKFEKSFAPKVMGTLHLHRLTERLPLDFFVCFSSVSAIIDGGGQSNYAAANAFMDRLMSHRRSRNLAGLSVNWGAWADVGMAARLAEKRTMDTSHFITKDEAFMSLEQLILNQNVQGVVCKIGARQASEAKSRMLLNLSQKNDVDTANVGELERVFRQNPNNGTVQNVEIFLQTQVNKVLGADAMDDVAFDAEFVSLGVDSLSMTELKNTVERGTGLALKMAIFFANPTIRLLAKHLTAEYGERFAFGDASAAAGGINGGAAENRPDLSIDFVPMGDGANGRPIFCIPGLNGNIFDFTDFVAESTDKYKVLVGEISSNLATLETDIRKIAADAIVQMKRLQASGPYLLLGYSYGGVVALEIAHQLKGAGEEVAMLMMVDSFPHFYYRDDERFMNFMQALIIDSILAPMKLNEADYAGLATQIMETPADQLDKMLQGFKVDDTSASRVNIDLLNGIVEAGKKRSLAFYEPPKRIDGLKITYVRAGSYPRSMSLANLNGFLEDPMMRDEKYSWGNFVSTDFDVRHVDAQHNEILKSQNASTIFGIVHDLVGAEAT